MICRSPPPTPCPLHNMSDLISYHCPAPATVVFWLFWLHAMYALTPRTLCFYLEHSSVRYEHGQLSRFLFKCETLRYIKWHPICHLNALYLTDPVYSTCNTYHHLSCFIFTCLLSFLDWKLYKDRGWVLFIATSPAPRTVLSTYTVSICQMKT